MSAYLCARCGNLKESHDGCEAAPSPPYRPNQLLCQPCVDDREDDALDRLDEE